MKKKITLCMVLSTFIICAMLCLTNWSNDDAPTCGFTPEALKQTTWKAQMTVYNIEDAVSYTHLFHRKPAAGRQKQSYVRIPRLQPMQRRPPAFRRGNKHQMCIRDRV